MIDEMIFIGPRLFIQTYSCLPEAFPENTNCLFSARSMILVGDLGKLPRVKDKLLHASKKTRKVSWKIFNIVVTLDKKFMQQGDDSRHASFLNLLTNIRNAKPFLDD